MTSCNYSQAYQQGFDMTVRLLLSRGISHDIAEEMAQAAWSRGWERVHQLRNEERVTLWVNAIALNLYRRALRGEKRYQPLMDLSGGKDVDIAAIDLAKILASCGPSDRKLLLFQLNGMTIREIASEVGTTELAVRLRLMRARRAARYAK